MKLTTRLFILLITMLVINERQVKGGFFESILRVVFEKRRQQQEAIRRANEENQNRLNQIKEELERTRQQALAEARRVAEKAEQIRLEQERERAEKIADQQALEASQTRSLDVLNTNKRQAEVKIRQEENEALAYENVHREANQKEQMESREEYEKWTRSNLDQEKSALDETIRLVIELGRKWTEKS